MAPISARHCRREATPTLPLRVLVFKHWSYHLTAHVALSQWPGLTPEITTLSFSTWVTLKPISCLECVSHQHMVWECQSWSLGKYHVLGSWPSKTLTCLIARYLRNYVNEMSIKPFPAKTPATAFLSFYFILIFILKCVYSMCRSVQCTKKPEEGIGCPGAQILDVCEQMGPG